MQRTKPPKKGVTEIFDLGYPGLCLRVSYGGTRSFDTFYRAGGKLRRETLGKWPALSLAQARQLWRERREAIGRGEDPSRPKATLFETVVEEWLRRDQSKNKASSLYQVTRSVEDDLLPAWRGRRVDTIGKRDVIELLDSIADRGAPQTARATQAFIGRFFAWCLERDILQSDPTAGMPRVGSNVERDRVLSDSELRRCGRHRQTDHSVL